MMQDSPSENADGKKESLPSPRGDEASSFWELLKFALVALLIVIPVRLFIAQPFIVSGTSMVPTFEHGEYLIVDELSYRFHPPARGDVIIFRYPADPTKFFIKRVIGLPGETISIEGSAIAIGRADGSEIVLDEPYVKRPSQNDLSVSLGEDEYFVMGDNRSASSDSRAWGPLDERYIVGRAFVRLFPVAHAGFFPGDIARFSPESSGIEE